MPRPFRLHPLDGLVALMGVGTLLLIYGGTRPRLDEYEPAISEADAASVVKLSWKDLKSLDAQSGEAGAELRALDGETVAMPGYIVPLEDEQSRSAYFLLVPYVGACIHSPAPPANQIIVVEMETGPVEFEMWEPYWATGVLSIETTESPYGPVGFQMRGLRIDPLEISE